MLAAPALEFASRSGRSKHAPLRTKAMLKLVCNTKPARDISSLELSVGAGLPAMNDSELRNL